MTFFWFLDGAALVLCLLCLVLTWRAWSERQWRTVYVLLATIVALDLALIVQFLTTVGRA